MRGGDGFDDVPEDEEEFESWELGDPEHFAAAEVGLVAPPGAAALPQGDAQLEVHYAPGHRQAAPPPGAPPKRGTGAWLRSRRSDPITPGCSVTVLQAAYWLGTMKNENRVTDEVIDRMCGMIHKLLLPPGNLFPPSYHMVKAVLEVESSSTCAKHVCDKCWSLFTHMEPIDYSACCDDVCTKPGCGNRRFNVSDSGVVAPKRTMYQFDVRATVLDLMDPIWESLELYRNQRKEDFNNNTTFWGSPAGHSLDQATGFKFSQPGPDEVAIPFGLGTISKLYKYAVYHRIVCHMTVVEPAGGDGVQIFTNKVYGTLVVGLRITEAPAGLVMKNVTWAPVCIVQGPTEPGSLHEILAGIRAFFEKHDPGNTLIHSR